VEFALFYGLSFADVSLAPFCSRSLFNKASFIPRHRKVESRFLCSAQAKETRRCPSFPHRKTRLLTPMITTNYPNLIIHLSEGNKRMRTLFLAVAALGVAVVHAEVPVTPAAKKAAQLRYRSNRFSLTN